MIIYLLINWHVTKDDICFADAGIPDLQMSLTCFFPPRLQYIVNFLL